MKIVVCGGKVLIRKTHENQWSLPDFVEGIPLPESDDIFVFGENGCFEAFESPKEYDMDESAWVDIRKSAILLSSDTYKAVAKASELLFWNRCNRFCSRCGAKMHRSTEISKICEKCSCEIWPQISPAIIVLVRKGEEALLVHAKNFSRPFFGLVAGFVETGESLEETVKREVKEETSLEIENIKYYASQSWPFPAQLMIGFTADYVSGEVRFADGELSEGGFFTKNNLPEIPTPPSIARELIDKWVNSEL